MKLYEYNEAIEDLLLNAVDPETGEIKEGMLEQITELKLGAADKMENVACWIKSLEAEQLALKTEVSNLTNRMKSKGNQISWAKEYLKHAMITNGYETKAFETPKCKLKITKSSVLQVSDIDLVPDEFKRIPEVVPVADKNAIKAAIKAGEEVNGAFIVTNQNLQVK